MGTEPLTKNTIKQYCNHIEQEKFGKGKGPFRNGTGRYLCRITGGICPNICQICSGAVLGKANLTKCPGSGISEELANEIKIAREEAGIKAGLEYVRDARESNDCPNLKRDAQGKITPGYSCKFTGKSCALFNGLQDKIPQFYGALNRCPAYKLSQDIGDKIESERTKMKESALENKIGDD
jgi:hypothetical protein